MALTSLGVPSAAPKEKPYKLSGGNGLHLLIQPSQEALVTSAGAPDFTWKPVRA